MELERFKTAWCTRPVEDEYGLEEEELLERVKQRTQQLRRRIFWRDIVETLAAILVAVVFGAASLSGGWLMQLGAAVIIAAAAFVVIVLHTARRRRRTGPDASLRHGLEGELEIVERQIKLLRNVAYWYIAPLYVGALLFSIGVFATIPMPDGRARGIVVLFGSVASTLILCVVGALIWWMNQVAVRKQLAPLRDRLAACLEGLAEGSAHGGGADLGVTRR